MVAPLVRSEIISRLSLALLLSRFCGTAVACIYIYIFFSLLLPPRAFCTAPLPLFYIHSPSLDPYVHLCRRTQLRRGPSCLFVRFTLDRSYFLSHLSAATPSPVGVGRSRSFLPPFPHPPSVRRTLRSPFPPRALRLFLQPPASSVLYSERGGPGPETRGAAMLTRSARSLASPRFASLRLWRVFVERGAARRGASCPPLLPPPSRRRWTPRRCC